MRRRRRAPALAVAILFLGTACQDSITEMSIIEDDALDSPEEIEPLVNGMGRAFAHALNLTAFTGAVIAREVGASGGFLVFGVPRLQRAGVLDPNDTDPHWIAAHQARWAAEDGVRRLRRILGDDFASSPLAARALLYVGFANRLLGENMCRAVIDGGPAGPPTVHFDRAEAAFTEALEIARQLDDTELALAALAGRATARAGLRDWDGARSDAAGAVEPASFRFVVQYSALEQDQYNRIYWGTANQPYRNLTVWDTYYDDYYSETGDQRVAWTVDPEYPEGDNGVPWYIQLKYRTRDAPIALVTAREMRLIVAEAALRDGDLDTALAELDALRGPLGLPSWEADTVEEGWTALKRERGIELWLEGRRLGDLHRWIDEATPGAAEDMTGRSLCFPIGHTELATNPNLP